MGIERLQENHDALLEEVATLRGDPSEMTLGKCSDYLLRLCDENGGESYGTWRVDRDGQVWSLTAQREDGKTPTEDLDALRAQLVALRVRVADALAHLERGEFLEAENRLNPTSAQPSAQEEG